jgi:hypothetical protein
MSEIERQWYWDRRSNKAFYPVDVGDGTVRLVSVWHRDEVEGALDAGTFEPLDDLDFGNVETTFDLMDSFRFPEDVGDE